MQASLAAFTQALITSRPKRGMQSSLTAQTQALITGSWPDPIRLGCTRAGPDHILTQIGGGTQGSLHLDRIASRPN